MMLQLSQKFGAVADRVGAVTADLFWDTATSYPMMLLLAAIALVAIVIAHLPRIAARIPVIGEYVRAAAVVQIVVSAMLMIAIGYHIADARADVARLRTESDALKSELLFKSVQIENLQATAADASRLRAEAEGHARDAKGQLDAMRSKLGVRPKNGCGFTDGELGWVRSLQRRRQHR